MNTLIEEFWNCYDYFYRPSEFPDLFDQVFFITFK